MPTSCGPSCCHNNCCNALKVQQLHLEVQSLKERVEQLTTELRNLKNNEVVRMSRQINNLRAQLELATGKLISIWGEV
jgi:FtsZ-binding cell division protein ZapB